MAGRVTYKKACKMIDKLAACNEASERVAMMKVRNVIKGAINRAVAKENGKYKFTELVSEILLDNYDFRFSEHEARTLNQIAKKFGLNE